jgi:hypothetical protein
MPEEAAKKAALKQLVADLKRAVKLAA